MSDQEITQAEIDALLSAINGGSQQSSNDIPVSPELQPDDLPLLQSYLADYLSHVVSSLSTLTGILCEGALADLQIVTGQEVSNLGAPRVLVGQIELVGGLNGSAYFLFPAPLGAMVIRQLLKDAESLGEDGCTKALASILAEASRLSWERLASQLGWEVTVSSASVREAGSYLEACQELPETKVLAVGADLAVGDAMGRMLLLLPGPMARPLVAVARAKRPPAPAGGVVPCVAVAPHTSASEAEESLQASRHAPPVVQPAHFPSLSPPAATAERPRNLDLLMDVRLRVTVEIGRTRRHIRDVLALGPGHVLELDRLANEQVDVLVNGKLVARAEVVVVDENYGARITDIISPQDRIQAMR